MFPSLWRDVAFEFNVFIFKMVKSYFHNLQKMNFATTTNDICDGVILLQRSFMQHIS